MCVLEEGKKHDVAFLIDMAAAMEDGRAASRTKARLPSRRREKKMSRRTARSPLARGYSQFGRRLTETVAIVLDVRRPELKKT